MKSVPRKLDFDSSAVDRLMQSPVWCAWMTDGLFFLFKICIFTHLVKNVLFPQIALRWLLPQCRPNECSGGILSLHLGTSEFPTIQAKAPPGQGMKGPVSPSSPVASPLRFEGGCVSHEPQRALPCAGAGWPASPAAAGKQSGRPTPWGKEKSKTWTTLCKARYFSLALESTGVPVVMATPDTGRLQKGLS